MNSCSKYFEWLPVHPDWNAALDAARQLGQDGGGWKALSTLSQFRLGFLETIRLDRAIARLTSNPENSSGPSMLRLAVLGSSTLAHLIPGIRIGALRRGIQVEIYQGPYGMYRQEIEEQDSGLHRFRPEVVLFSFDARHVLGAKDSTVATALRDIRTCWQHATRSLSAIVIQQTILPIFDPILGNNDHRYSQSRLAMSLELNHELRRTAAEEGVHLLSVDVQSARDGLDEWYDEVLWHNSKQEVHPRVAPIYGDLVGRLLAALRGRSSKCLVLDLDNTLWGGVVGDDGLEGIVLGQGSATGEAYVAFQRFALELAERGVILAVCSKNDLANASAVFDRHPEMVLRRKDIACFIANWQDKASNLLTIAKTLKIGLDSLVFVDDSPFERNLVREAIPEVAVPELPEDPSYCARTIANAGYFESLGTTAEDQERSRQYQANSERDLLRESAIDLKSYLRDLKMELHWAVVDEASLPRTVQLMNKSNQFNLTTPRTTEPAVRAILADPSRRVLCFRLLDRFGDNGIISVVIGTLETESTFVLDAWLMSCRVLGRGVEDAVLSILAKAAKEMGARFLIGKYQPTAKNGMVREHYRKMGFRLVEESPNGSTRWELDLLRFQGTLNEIRILEEVNEHRANLQPTDGDFSRSL